MILRAAVEDQQLLEQIAHHQSQMREYRGNESEGTYLDEHGDKLDLLLDRLAIKVRKEGLRVRANINISVLLNPDIKFQFISPTMLQIGDFADGHTLSATPEQWRQLALTIWEHMKSLEQDHPDQQQILDAEYCIAIEEGDG